jgi:hypothetical protein
LSDLRAPNAANGGRRLRIVLPDHELLGHAPHVFERLAKVSTPGGAEHRAVIGVTHALVQSAVARGLPPSARRELAPALAILEGFATGRLSRGAAPQAARDARAAAFSALGELEARTLKAVVQAEAQQRARSVTTELAEHAGHTMRRFLGLSVHHTVAALCHALDAIDAPAPAVSVPSDVCGALAYSRTALGSVRNPEFQGAALDQARFEHERSPRDEALPLRALQIQVFHEYLGARWRAHGDEERHAAGEFIAWALGSVDPS